MNLDEMLGKDLSGHKIVQWFEVRRSTAEFGSYVPLDEYYTDEALAEVMAKGAGFYGADGHVASVFVLVKHGDRGGFVLSGLKPGRTIKLADEQERKRELARKAMAKLDPAERKMLGLPDLEGESEAEDGETDKASKK